MQRREAEQERTEAWLGDAVLALFAREWILKDDMISDSDREAAFVLMTSNAFLAGRGNPTRMEAEIGRIYREAGLAAAFQYIEATWIPLFRKQWKNRKGK